MKKKAIILGGGISGLTLRYYLSRKYPDLDITLFEKEHRLGGIIESMHEGGFFFEKGPRTFKASKSHHLLSLISELGMEKEVVVSEKRAARRFLWKDDQLHALPMQPLPLLSSPLTRKLIPALMKEWKQDAGEPDETIHSFAKRRLGIYAAEVFFDPMTLGIYAGDIRKLSIASCFPSLKQLEKSHGSITKGLFKKRKEGKQRFSYPDGMRPSCLFTLREGVETLVTELTAKGKGEIHLNTCIDQVQLKNDKVQLSYGDETWEADHLFCALSPKGAYQLTKSWDDQIQAFFQNLETASLSVIHLGFQSKILDREGFGYLIPSSQGEKILGVIFDSSVFPQQNLHDIETRMTVMMGGALHPDHHMTDKEERLAQALTGIQKHLGISAKPTYKNVIQYTQAIPQFTVGHQGRVAAFREVTKQKYPQVTFLGNYLDGVSISDCIAGAESASHQLNI